LFGAPSRAASEMNVENHYEIIIFWSDEDEAFVADVPELPGCMAHGASQAEALSNSQQAIALWIDTARELGNPVPEPKGRRLVYA
jgi:predicted RNase H-like HicB family nuclease